MLAETSIWPSDSPTTRTFVGPSAVMDIAPGRTPGNLVAGCPSTGTSHSTLPSLVPARTSRSSASYQVRARGSVMLGPSRTGWPMDDGPADVRAVGFSRWPEVWVTRSMAASWSRRSVPVCVMAATRTPSGAMPRPMIFPAKALGIGALLLPLLVCGIAKVLPPSASHRSPLRSQLIAVTPDVVMELDGLVPPDAHTSTVFPSAVTPAAYWLPGDTATRDRAGTLCG